VTARRKVRIELEGAPFVVTSFRDLSGDTLTTESMTLDQLKATIDKTSALNKGDLPLIKLATFGDKRSDKGSLRHNANVLKVHGVEGDYDGESMSIDTAARKLVGIECLLYTSPSHMPAKPRWRVIAPFSVALNGKARDKMLRRIDARLGGVLAKESYTLSQAYFIGSVKGGSTAEVRVLEGKRIDRVSDIDETVKEERAHESSDEADLIKRLQQGDDGRHEAVTVLAAKFAARGMVTPGIIKTLRALMDASDARRDAKFKARYAEIVPAAESAVRKFAPETASAVLIGPDEARATLEELCGVPYEPPMIVEAYLSQDAGGYVGEGGKGKTTLTIRECVHIILGIPLYGRAIVRSGPTLIVTAEDSRAVMFSRLNQICRTMLLSKEKLLRVQQNFLVEDISTTPTRLAHVDRQGGVVATRFVDELIEKYGGVGLCLTTFDPTSLIGPGEMSGNDGMSELMRIGRLCSVRLSSAVRLIHHVSQVVARSGIADQYAGRGATAFADNSRSNHQVKILRERKVMYEQVEYRAPEWVRDADLADGSVTVIFHHKLSYGKRDPTPIVILRNGFAFRDDTMERIHHTPEARAERDAEVVEQIVALLRSRPELRVNKSTLSNDYARDVQLPRDVIRKGVEDALAMGRLESVELARGDRRGRLKEYLRVVEVTP